VHSNRPNKKVGLRPPIRATRFRAKRQYILPSRQMQDTPRLAADRLNFVRIPATLLISIRPPTTSFRTQQPDAFSSPFAPANVVACGERTSVLYLTDN